MFQLLHTWLSLYTFVLLVTSPTSFAADSNPSVDLLDRSRLEFAILDYPKLHNPWLRQQLQTLDPQKQPIPWVRVCWALQFNNEEEDRAWIKANFANCVRIAAEQKLLFEWVSFRFTELEDLEQKDFPPKFKPFLEEVRQLKDPESLAIVLARTADYFLDARDVDKAMPYLIEANRMVDSKQSTSLATYQVTKVALSIALDYQGKKTESTQVDEAVIKHDETIGLRSMLAQALYNRGFTRIFQTPLDLAGAREDLMAAKKQGEQVQNNFIVAASHYGLANAESKDKRFKEANDLYLKALELFTRLNNRHWIVVCNMQIADNLIDMEKYKEALPYLDAAEKLSDNEGRERKNFAVRLRYMIYKGLKDWKKALQYLEKNEEEAAALAQIREKDEYNRASVSLGLQLEQQKTNSLQQENQLQAQKLQEADRFRIFSIVLGVLSLSTISLLILSIRQIKRVQASRRKVQMILDNIDEGLLTVDENLAVGPDYSKYLSEMIKPTEPIAGQDFMGAIFAASLLPNEQKTIIREVLQASFGEESIAWEMNAGNLPTEVHMQTQKEEIFVVRWIPIFAPSGRMEQLLISLTNVTQARALEKALSEQEQRLHSLPDILREIVQVKPEHIVQLLQSTGDTLDSLENGADKQDTLRRLHTQKGVARTLGLRALSQELHDLESALLQQSWSTQLAATREIVHEYRDYGSILHQGKQTVAGKNWLPSAVEPHLETWLRQMVDSHLPIQAIRIDDGVLNWQTEDFAILQELCLHAINNSLEHGFIFPRRAGQRVNPPVIDVIARLQDGWLSVELSDNGAGMDMEKIQTLATARGFQPKYPETVTDVLFMDGVSTSNSLTLTSGRGVGLAAIKARVLQRGGELGIRNQTNGNGTVIWLRLPK